MRLIFAHGWHNATKRGMRAKRDAYLMDIEGVKSDWLLHCMGGWRMFLCLADNLVPHKPAPTVEEGLRGRRGFRWICRLHDWAGRESDEN